MERKINAVNVRYSTVLCTGETRAGKTKFCSLLMNKTKPLPGTGDHHTVFVKKGSETEWKEVNSEHLEALIDQINQKQCAPLNLTAATDTINSEELLDILILLDINVLSSTICLLQPAMVTFVTYRLRGHEKFCTRSHEFIKELMSTSCFEKKLKFNKLEIAGNPQKDFHTAFVGTHVNGDKCLYNKEATMANENVQNIKDRINCTIHDIPLSLWYIDDSLLHVINIESHEDKNISLLRNRLEKTVSETSVYQIPVSWVLLSLKVHKMCHEHKRQFVQYSMVLERIWKYECNMYSESDLKFALKFFHHQGVLFHFDTVEGASDFVFARCCWMFDRLKYLLTELEDKGRNYDAKELLMKEGLLNSKMVREIEFDGPGEMTFQTFIHILQHLKFIAPVNENEYFVPSILKSYESKKDTLDHFGTKYHEALLITFSPGSLHRSMFCYLAAYLLKNKPDKWTKPCYDKQTRQQYIFKDMIAFSKGVDDHICIIDKTFFLEVQIYTERADQCDKVLHTEVFEAIKEALRNVCKSLEVPSEDCKYGFLCTKCKSNDHLMILKDLKEHHAYCSKSDRALHLSDDHIVWLEVCVYVCVCVRACVCVCVCVCAHTLRVCV